MSYSEIRKLTPGTPEWGSAVAWASKQFDKALLFLGDTTKPLLAHAKFWCQRDARDQRIGGVAVCFRGFRSLLISVAADDTGSCLALIDAAVSSRPATLVTHESQLLPASIVTAHADNDPWLDAVCCAALDHASIVALDDARELAWFYAAEGVQAWHPAMLEFGHCYGVRDAAGALIAAGGLNFVLPEHGYAQLGGLVTAKRARGQGHATRILSAIQGSLARAGIARCGLFADAADPTLPSFYTARGFAARGRFRFTPLES
jgi:hypothetical protein